MIKKSLLAFALISTLSGCATQKPHPLPEWVVSAHQNDETPFHYYGFGSSSSYKEAYNSAHAMSVEKYATWVGVTYSIETKSELHRDNNQETFASSNKMTGSGQAFSQGLKVFRVHSHEAKGVHQVHLILAADQHAALEEKARQKDRLKPVIVVSDGIAFTDIKESGGLYFAKMKGEDVATSIATASLSLKANQNNVELKSNLGSNGDSEYEVRSHATVQSVEKLGVEHTVSGETLVTKVKVKGTIKPL